MLWLFPLHQPGNPPGVHSRRALNFLSRAENHSLAGVGSSVNHGFYFSTRLYLPPSFIRDPLLIPECATHPCQVALVILDRDILDIRTSRTSGALVSSSSTNDLDLLVNQQCSKEALKFQISFGNAHSNAAFFYKLGNNRSQYFPPEQHIKRISIIS